MSDDVFHRSAAPILPLEPAGVERHLCAQIQAIADRWPDRLAVRYGERSLSYGELLARANRLAHEILERCGPDNKPIAVLTGKNADLLVALLGTLAARKIYVPLDPGANHAHNLAVFEDAEPQAIITVPSARQEAAAIAGARAPEVPLLILDDDAAAAAQLPQLGSARLDVRPPAIEVSPDDLSMILYTSGSTGKPKGVMQNHRNVLSDLRQVIYTGRYRHDDRAIVLPSVTFIGANSLILAGLLAGAALFPFELREKGWENLLRLIEDEKISIYHSSGTVFFNLTSRLTSAAQVASVGLVRLAGEPIYRRDFELYKRWFGDHCTFANALGTTETNILRQFFADKNTELGANIVPAGYPVETKKVTLHAEDGSEVAPGEVGEIVVESRHIALGYWRRPDLTEKAFRPGNARGERRYHTGDYGRMRADGCLDYLGRIDSQIKLHGQKVPLPELEGALLNHPQVRETCVVAKEISPGDRRLIAYVVPHTRPGPQATELRNYLLQALPSMVVPSLFMNLDTLPRTHQGKVALEQLPIPGRRRPPTGAPPVEPRDALERMLVDIWIEVLAVDAVGIEDELVELGGNSLLATSIATRVFEDLTVQLSVRDIFEAKTISGLAALLERRASELGIGGLAREIERIAALSDEEVDQLLEESR